MHAVGAISATNFEKISRGQRGGHHGKQRGEHKSALRRGGTVFLVLALLVVGRLLVLCLDSSAM